MNVRGQWRCRKHIPISWRMLALYANEQREQTQRQQLAAEVFPLQPFSIHSGRTIHQIKSPLVDPLAL